MHNERLFWEKAPLPGDFEAMKPQSDDLQDYLRATPIIDSDHPSVAATATQVRSHAATDVESARRLFEWVRDTIPHSWDIRSRAVTCSASEVLERGTGICMAKSHLLAAMCRSVGIPSGFCYQIFRRSAEYGGGTGLHGLNAVFLASLDRWVRVDARGNKPGVDAQFGLDEEKLAFPPDPQKGEYVVETIFTDPDPGVVAYLTTNTELHEAWADLPESLVPPS